MVGAMLCLLMAVQFVYSVQDRHEKWELGGGGGGGAFGKRANSLVVCDRSVVGDSRVPLGKV